MSPPAKIVILGMAAAALVAAGFQFGGPPRQAPSPKTGGILPKEGAFPDFKLFSPAFVDSGDIPAKYTCDGANISPRLEITGVPPETKSLAIVMNYLDPASGNISVHWLMWNINPKAAILPEGVAPEGAVQGMNDFKRLGYLGPCLDSGRQRSHFVFSLYALNWLPSVATGANTGELIHAALAGHTIAATQLNGYYGQ